MDEPAPEVIPVIKEQKPRAPHLAILFAALNTVQGWLLIFFFPLNLPVTIGLHYLTHRYSKTTNIVSIFLQPYIVLVAAGIVAASVGYWNGRAEFCLAPHQTDFGTYSSAFGTRTQGFQGDLVIPIMFLIPTANDLTLYWHCFLFGPVRGNYTGPLPSVDEAESLVDTNFTSVPAADFETKEIKIDERAVVLTDEALHKCQKFFELHAPGYTEYFHESRVPYKVALYDQDCLIIRSQTSDGDEFITLVDASTGRFIEQVVTHEASKYYK